MKKHEEAENAQITELHETHTVLKQVYDIVFTVT